MWYSCTSGCPHCYCIFFDKSYNLVVRGSSGLWLVGGSTGYNVRDEFPG